MSNIRVGRAVVAVVAMSIAAIGGTACSSDNDAQTTTTTTLSVEESYCAAWADVIVAFAAFGEVDIVAGGTSSLKQAFSDLEAAVDDLEVAADEQITPSVEAFLVSLQTFSTTLTSPDLPIDRTEQVRAARADVDDQWTEMVDTLKTTCPEVETPTS